MQQGMDQSSLSRLVVSAFDWVIALSKQSDERTVSGIGKFEVVDNNLQVVSQLRTRKLQLA
jgi:hypothetical protein